MKKRQSAISVFRGITAVYVFAIITLLPLFFGTASFQNIASAKYNFFFALGVSYIAIMAATAVKGLLGGTVKPISPAEMLKRSTWPQRFAVCYLLFTWVSACASQYFPETVTGGTRHENALTISICVVSFLLISAYGKPDARLLWGLGISVTLFSVVCFLQFAGLNPFGMYPDGMNYYDAGVKYSGEHLGTIGNVDFIAAYLCLVIPIMWIALLRLSGKLRFLLIAPLLCTLAVLFKMHVLSGFVGVLVGGIIALPVVLQISCKTKRILCISFGAVAVMSLVAVFFVDFGGSLHELHEILHGNFDESFGSGRFHIWRQVLARIPEHFWLGTGPDTMLNADLESFVRFDEALDVYIVSHIDTAHNDYLNIFFHQGVFAFVSYGAMLVSAMVLWIKSSSESSAAAMLGGACLCHCLHAVFGISQSATTPLFWVALALLCGVGVQAKRIADFNVGKMKRTA